MYQIIRSSLESYQNAEVGRKQPWSSRGGRGTGRQSRTAGTTAGANIHSNLVRKLSCVICVIEHAFLFQVIHCLVCCHCLYKQAHPSYASPGLSSPGSASAASASSSRAAACRHETSVPPNYSEGDEYPQTVQELVMNGFELPKVLKAYDLIGDNFDDLLAFLMSTNGS